MKSIVMTISMLLIFLFINIKSYGNKDVYKYIQKYDSISIELMLEYKIPASIILGVSMHESGYGKSYLSREKNNFFGIKLRNGNYREYDSDYESFKDFCQLISTSVFYVKKYNYLVDNNISEPNRWLSKIQESGYAEDIKWANKINTLINNYDLYELDSTNYYVGDLIYY
jgi:flagellum-specific peptidoglycan hydrolase FlgJ